MLTRAGADVPLMWFREGKNDDVQNAEPWTADLVAALQKLPAKVRQPAVAVVGKGRGVVHVEDLDDEEDVGGQGVEDRVEAVAARKLEEL